ncbi:MAG: glucosamine-6-phosphate deaminase [Balneolaceae bacterium]|nr:glucosamine-6-phosphate deaminase [Balneolaceae bacterium]
MNIKIFDSKKELGKQSATDAANKIRSAIQKNGEANIILATGASQFETLGNLVEEPDIDWSKVTMFHLDEYVGLAETHPASFRKYLKERFEFKVPDLKEAYYIQGDRENSEKECRRLNKIISKVEIDVALVGIGENGHLAFNDPPADFETETPYIVVELDEACRRQQMGEGWFDSIEEVPKRAISMSIKQIMKSKSIICSVPDERKAEAVKNCLEGEVTNMNPASVLQNHDECTVYLDQESASLLSHQ